MDTAVRVNSLLTAYIAVHDDIFRASLRKVIPVPGIFKATDYCKHRLTLAEISSQLRICESQADTGSSGTDRDPKFASTLAHYIRSLDAAVTQLQRITDSLCRKAKGEHGHSIGAYNQDCDQYNQLVEQYKNVGETLNSLVRGM